MSSRHVVPALLGSFLLQLAGDAVAQAPPNPPPDAADTVGRDRRLDDVEQRLQALEEENRRLAEEVELLREDQGWTDERVEQLMPLTTKVGGYVDVGLFHVTGDGRGIRRDTLNRAFPEYAYAGSWVLLGDPLSTAINSRGDPADVTESDAVTLNPIDANDNVTFIVNNVNLALSTSPVPELSFSALVDFLPRSRNVSVSGQTGLGDFLDAKLATVEYRPPIDEVTLTLTAGKVDSILGYEYREQEAPARLTVTPSLLCRYTCGRPLGLRATAGLLDDRLEVGMAVTNGSHSIEGFPFASETDTNHGKTLAGRLLYRVDVGAGLELGVSGAWGAQDFQADDGVLQRHIGGHAHLDVDGFVATAEYARGDAQGQADPDAPGLPCGLTPCLEYQSAYLLAGYRVTNWLLPYARADWRDALHRSGTSFVYVSELFRATIGVRLEASRSLVAKLEYTANRELGRIPEFPNDIYTSSLVGRF